MYIFSKLLFYWLFFLTAIAISTPIAFDKQILLPPLIITFLCYASFNVGSKFVATCAVDKIELRETRKSFNSILSFFCFFSSLYYIKFYTGLSFADSLMNLMGGVSNYNAYQNNTYNNSLASFTSDQYIPFAAGVAYTVIMVYVFLASAREYVLSGQISYIPLLLVVCAQAFAGITRGTSIEFMILFTLIVYCFAYVSILKRRPINKRVVAIVALIGVLAFYVNVSFRFETVDTVNCISRDFCLDEHGFFDFSKSLQFLFYYIGAYFSFGLIHFAYTLNALVDLNGFFGLIIPHRFNSESQTIDVCRLTIDCGAAWAPDISNLFVALGLLIFVFLFSMAGFVSKKLFIGARYGNISNALNFFLFLQMLSLPVGNFVVSSYVLIVSITVFLFIHLFQRFANR